MKRFRDFRLGVKQRLGMGAMLLILAIVSLFAIVQMDRLGKEIDEINSLSIPSMIALSSINLDVSTLRSYQLQFAITRRQEDREALSASMATLIDSITANRDTYDRLASVTPRLEPFDAQRDSLYESFDEYWDDYQASFMELLFGTEESTDLYVEVLAGAGDTYVSVSQSLEALIDVNKQRSAYAALRAQTNSVHSRRIIILALIVTIVLSLMLSAILIRFVTHPIRKLEEAAQEIARGRLDVQLDVDSDDEIGGLARSFNQMTASLAIAQQQLLIKEKLASLGQLTAGIAHEIKNPLNFVNNFAVLSVEIVDELEEVVTRHAAAMPPEDQKQALELMADLRMNAGKIADHGRRADGIVRGMLLHSRGAQGERQPIDVNAFVDENTTLAYHGIRAEQPDMTVDIVRQFDAEAGRVVAVPQDIGRVLINLLNNAFYAVHERSKEPGFVGPPRVRIETRNGEDGVSVSIADNGGGIPESLRHRIFEPFFTTKPTGEGTGLGLSLSYDIITQGHGGTLTLDTAVGQGTTFTIWLPRGGTF
ncbi:MAG: ATP-binding protein [Rhodothermales bacterium]|nr:ATP-binding protein [Rhodothermales bacterium]